MVGPAEVASTAVVVAAFMAVEAVAFMAAVADIAKTRFASTRTI